RVPRIRNLLSISVAVTCAGVVATAIPAYAAAGDLDPTLGVGGAVTTDFGANPPEPEIANEMVIQPDGKIVAAGRAGTDQFPVGGDGSLDPSFGTGGTAQPVLGNSGHLFTLKLLASGTFLAAGSAFNTTQGDFLLARFTSTGALDTTFGTGGLVTTAITAQNDLVFDMAVTDTGQIILAGEANSSDALGVTGDTHVALARYHADGSPDATFGTAGII